MVTIVKNDLIKTVKNKKTVNVKLFHKFLEEIEKETSFEKWTKGRKINVAETSSYQDFGFYGIFKIRFFRDTDKFLGFVDNLALIYDLISKTEELPLFMKNFDVFIERLTTNLDLKWNDREIEKLNQIRWFSQFYVQLKQLTDNVLFSIKNWNFYLKESSTYIEFSLAFINSPVGIENNGKRFIITVGRFNEDNIKRLNALLEKESFYSNIQSDLLSGMFKKSNTSNDLIGEIINLNFGFHLSTQEEKLQKYIKKSVPGSYFDILFTSDIKEEVVRTDYFNFTISYYKCDFGYFLLNFSEKEVVYKETRKEVIDYCLREITTSSLKINEITNK